MEALDLGARVPSAFSGDQHGAPELLLLAILGLVALDASWPAGVAILALFSGCAGMARSRRAFARYPSSLAPGPHSSMSAPSTHTPTPIVHSPAAPARTLAPRSRWLAASLAQIAALVAPLLLGFDFPRFVPAAPATPWVNKIDEGVRNRAERLDGRRVIFVGGSNVLFGVNARSLEKLIGVPVVPYGTHAGLGMDLISARASEIVRAGDIVVFSPELEQFRKSFKVHKAIRSDWLATHASALDDGSGRFPGRTWLAARQRCHGMRMALEAWFWLPLQKYARSRVDAEPKTPREVPEAMRSLGDPYALSSIDDDGNLILPRPRPDPLLYGRQLGTPTSAEQYDWERSNGGIGLAWMAEVCRERGALLCVMPGFRVLPREVKPGHDEKLRVLEQDWLRLAEGLGAVRLLDAGATVAPFEEGCDTLSHLNDIGVARMEPILAVALVRVIEAHPATE